MPYLIRHLRPWRPETARRGTVPSAAARSGPGPDLAHGLWSAGVSVAADSCNPVELTRREWEQTALNAGARYVNIEVVCSDEEEHRTRVEARRSSVIIPSYFKLF